VFAVQHYKKLDRVRGGGLRFGEKFEVNILEGYVISMQCNVDFGYRHTISSVTEKNHGKPESNRLVLKTRHAPT
jgi:hypothetical protein